MKLDPNPAVYDGYSNQPPAMAISDAQKIDLDKDDSRDKHSEDCTSILGSSEQFSTENDVRKQVQSPETPLDCMQTSPSKIHAEGKKRGLEDAPQQQCDVASSSSSSSVLVASSTVDQEEAGGTGTQDLPCRKKRRSEGDEDVVSEGPQIIHEDVHEFDTLDGLTPLGGNHTFDTLGPEETKELVFRGKLDRIFGQKCLTEGDVLMQRDVEGVRPCWYTARIPNELFE